MATRLCDTCKSATAILFCRPDSAFLCLSCDSRIHAANKLVSRHARVWLCEVCENAPAEVTCKADAATLCVTCDRDIHSANPLARRHERVPVTPFFDSSSVKPTAAVTVNFLDDCCLSDLDGDATEEEEAASWLLATATTGDSPEMNTGQYLFSDSDPYVDLDCGLVDPKMEAEEQNSSGSDGVVPVQSSGGGGFHIPLVTENCFVDLDLYSAKVSTYGFNCINQSVSSSSLEVGVVPDGVSTAADIQNTHGGVEAANQQPVPVPLSWAEREARVMRYREKRKNRKFEKTIRYASRKAYAEVRPRIKGRFAKRSAAVAVDTDRHGNRSGFYSGFGIVPSF